MSRATTTVALTGVAVLLAAAVAFELGTGVGAADGNVTEGPRATQTAMPSARATAAAEHGDFAAAILARPLFAASRRPPATAAAVIGEAPRDNSLPRLAGIVIEGPARFAIFQPVNAGKPVSLGEGGEIGGRKIVTIAPLEVTLLGPEGEVHLHPFPANAFEHPITMATPTGADAGVPSADPSRHPVTNPHRVTPSRRPGRRPPADRTEP